jgi:hypothetical protein
VRELPQRDAHPLAGALRAGEGGVTTEVSARGGTASTTRAISPSGGAAGRLSDQSAPAVAAAYVP